MRSAAPIEGQLAFAVDLAVDLDEAELADQELVAPPAPDEPPTRAAVDRPADAAPPADRDDPDDWRAILDFERRWSGPLTSKQRAVRERFGISSARYHQSLDRALEMPDALVYDPALVGRLRRLREGRRRKRFAGRVDADPQPGGAADPAAG